MQYCNNGDMEEYMKKKSIQFFKESEAVFFLKQIMCGFQELHKNQIMHRDFKLANVFMHDDTLMIGDFGLAKSGATMTTTNVGTPLTKAPELSLSRGAYSSKADLWSIGVVFFQMVFGDWPFMANSEHQLLEEIKRTAGKNLKMKTNVQQISPEAEDLIRRLLTIDPKERIEWNEFFNHKIFQEKNDPDQFKNHYLITNQSCIRVNKNFDQVKHDGFQANKNETDPAKYGVKFEAKHLDVNYEDQGTFNTTPNHANDPMDEISLRYFHERNKIAFMFMTVKYLRLLMKDPAMDSMMGYVYPLAMGIAKKARILCDLNSKSLKYANNIFGLQGFETFSKSSKVHEALGPFNADSGRYTNYWNFLRGMGNDCGCSPQEMGFVNSLDKPEMFLPELDNGCKYLFKTVNSMQLPYDAQTNARTKHYFYLSMAFAGMAINSEPSFPYELHGRKYDWGQVKRSHEGMTDELLMQVIHRNS